MNTEIEYVVPITMRNRDGQRFMVCPICGKEYQQYLLCLAGFVGCRRCMGRSIRDVMVEYIRVGAAIMVEGAIQRLDFELAKRLGLMP